MRTLLKRKVAAIATTVAALLIGCGVAAAYWTSTGSGTVQASVGSASSVTLSRSVSSGIVPGGSEPVTFAASNPGTSGVQVNTIHLVSVSVDSAHSSCVTADFSMSDVSVNQSVPKGAVNSPITAAGSLLYANTAVN